MREGSVPEPIDDEVILSACLTAHPNPGTRRTYDLAWRKLAAYLGKASAPEGLFAVLAMSHAAAEAHVGNWREQLRAAGKASNTVATYLAAIRSVVQLAHGRGLVSWLLSVKSPPTQAYVGVTGLPYESYRAMLQVLADRTEVEDERNKRDLAILRLMFDLGLRVKELRLLDLADVDLAACTLTVVGHGQLDRSETVPIPPPCVNAINGWLAHRGTAPGPLWKRLNGAPNPGRLTARGIYNIVVALAKAAGVHTSPRLLRHGSIARSAKVTAGNVAAVIAHSRLDTVRPASFYTGERQAIAAETARLVSEDPD
jgi:integrase